MQELVIKKGKKEYIFLPQELVFKKKNKVIYTIKTSEIRMIIYNAEFHGLELLTTLLTSGTAPPPMLPHSFCIFLNGKKDKVIRWWIHPKYIKNIQEILDIPIGFYEAKKFC